MSIQNWNSSLTAVVINNLVKVIKYITRLEVVSPVLGLGAPRFGQVSLEGNDVLFFWNHPEIGTPWSRAPSTDRSDSILAKKKKNDIVT